MLNYQRVPIISPLCSHFPQLKHVESPCPMRHWRGVETSDFQWTADGRKLIFASSSALDEFYGILLQFSLDMEISWNDIEKHVEHAGIFPIPIFGLISGWSRERLGQDFFAPLMWISDVNPLPLESKSRVCMGLSPMIMACNSYKNKMQPTNPNAVT